MLMPKCYGPKLSKQMSHQILFWIDLQHRSAKKLFFPVPEVQCTGMRNVQCLPKKKKIIPLNCVPCVTSTRKLNGVSYFIQQTTTNFEVEGKC